MTVYEYVARQFNVEWGNGEVVGTTPLDTIDGDTSYVTAEWNGTSNTAATTFRLEPVGAPAPPESTWTAVRARLVWKRVTPNTPSGRGEILHAYQDGTSQIFVTNFGQEFSGVPDEDLTDGYVSMWTDADVTKWPRLLAADSFQAFRMGGTVGTPASQFHATYYRVFIEAAGDTYLRNHARTDGLGGNAPRNHQVTSQQRSLRNKGYR